MGFSFWMIVYWSLEFIVLTWNRALMGSNCNFFAVIFMAFLICLNFRIELRGGLNYRELREFYSGPALKVRILQTKMGYYSLVIGDGD